MSVIQIENWLRLAEGSAAVRERASNTGASPEALRKALCMFVRAMAVEGRSSGAAVALAKGELPSVRAQRGPGVAA